MKEPNIYINDIHKVLKLLQAFYAKKKKRKIFVLIVEHGQFDKRVFQTVYFEWYPAHCRKYITIIALTDELLPLQPLLGQKIKRKADKTSFLVRRKF